MQRFRKEPLPDARPTSQRKTTKNTAATFGRQFAAKLRTGESLELPDIDLDGRVSFAEAHAFALLTSNTIDISIKTSDAVLRAISKNKGSKQAGFITADAPYQELIACASPIDRAVLDGLSQQLGLKGSDRAAEARKLTERMQKEIKSIDERRKKGGRPYDGLRRTILAACQVRWPELSNRWDPKVFDLLHNDGDELATAIEEHPKYSDFTRLHDELESLAEKKLDQERMWVKSQRLLRVIDNITLAANLKMVASPDAQKRYQQLIELENSSL